MHRTQPRSDSVYGCCWVGPRSADHDGVVWRESPRLSPVMSIWDVVLMFVPTMLVAVAGIVLIEHLRISSERERYQHREYRADEHHEHSDGSTNGQAKRRR